MSPSILFLAITFYFALLFAVAYFVERESPAALRLSRSPFVYSLSLAVYCTSWTYYGSVGKAATSGLSFLAIYLGPTIMVCLWWILLRRMVIIKDKHRITSIADFISARYKKSQSLAALVTLIALIGSMPYIALQLEAVKSTLLLIIKTDTGEKAWLIDNSGPLIVLAMTFFTILFGARKLDPTERHKGMMAAIALESIIKLLAFSACGIFATYHLFHGQPESFLQSLTTNPATAAVFRISEGGSGYITWTTLIILGMSAILFLPRQFHVAVVENSAPENILPAMWQFPLYMFLINIFVIPIALYGITSGIPVAMADTYVLSIPFLHGNAWLALFVFLGGFSAAMSMIIIASMTLSTMSVNHLLLPLFNTLRPLAGMRRYLLGWRWISILLILSVGCWFQVELGSSYALVNMGLISFAAVLQFAPAALCAVFWPGGSMVGALSGLSAGFSVWFYTLLLPAFIKSGLFSTALLDNGPWGIRLLRPEHLFGLNALPPLSHTVFWSLLFNIGAFVLVSALFGQSEEEHNIAMDFMSVTQTKSTRSIKQSGDEFIDIDRKKAALLSVLNDYFHADKSEEIISTQMIEMSLHTKKGISIIDFAELYRRIEILLAGSIGAAMAHRAFDKENIFSEEEKASLAQAYAHILSRLNVSPQELVFFQSNPHPMWIYDLDTLRFLEVNDAAVNQYGYSRDEFLAMTVKDVRTDEDIPLFLETLAHDDKGMDNSRHGRHTKKDGSIIDVEIVSYTLLYDNCPARMILVRDITEQLRIQATSKRLLAAIEQTDETIVVTDPEGIVDYVNPAFERISGYTRKEIIGKKPSILKSGKHDAAFYAELWRTISSGSIWRGRFVNSRKDGTLYDEDAVISPVCDPSGRIVNYVAVKRYITENLRLEAQLQQAQKMESVGRLAGGVAHDFNNMLSVIIGYTQLALVKTDPADSRYQDLQEVYKAATRSATITRQLLAFARIQTIAPQTLDLNETIEGMLAMLRRLIGEDINLIWQPGASLQSIKMDPSQVDQILANLCVNARDAIAGVGTLTIETSMANLDGKYCASHVGAVPGKYIFLSVSDNGCGMDKETQAKIFEPFFTTKEVGKGTGLGLSTVYGIVKQNKGFINVVSEPGRGTTFSVYLPRYGMGKVDDGEAPEPLAKPGHGETILVVEDEVSVLKLTSKILNSLGYTVLTANCPQEALGVAEELKGEKIDLLITDVIMPEMNGRDLADLLLSSNPKLKHLFMSGYPASVIADKGVLKEGKHFIQKPFSAQELADKVYKVLLS